MDSRFPSHGDCQGVSQENFTHNICHITEIQQNVLFKHQFTEVILHILNFLHLSYLIVANISATFRNKRCQVLLDRRYWQGSEHSAVAPDPTRLQMCPNVARLSIPFSLAAPQPLKSKPPGRIWKSKLFGLRVGFVTWNLEDMMLLGSRTWACLCTPLRGL